MSDSPSDQSSKDLAFERTEWAEDRTLLANERTFAGWMRTGLAAVGVGAAFHALFGELEPPLLARAIASVFILAGIFVFFAAARSARKVCARLQAHAARPLEGTRLTLIAILFAAASFGLLVGIWLTAGL